MRSKSLLESSDGEASAPETEIVRKRQISETMELPTAVKPGELGESRSVALFTEKTLAKTQLRLEASLSKMPIRHVRHTSPFVQPTDDLGADNRQVHRGCVRSLRLACHARHCWAGGEPNTRISHSSGHTSVCPLPPCAAHSIYVTHPP